MDFDATGFADDAAAVDIRGDGDLEEPDASTEQLARRR